MNRLQRFRELFRLSEEIRFQSSKLACQRSRVYVVINYADPLLANNCLQKRKNSMGPGRVFMTQNMQGQTSRDTVPLSVETVFPDVTGLKNRD